MSKSKNQLPNFIKYSGLAFQMGIIIFGGAFGGLKLDECLENDFPAFTLGLTIFSVIIAIYLGIKDLLKNNTQK